MKTNMDARSSKMDAQSSMTDAKSSSMDTRSANTDARSSHMDARSLGESKGNYTNSSVRQPSQSSHLVPPYPYPGSKNKHNSGNGKLAVGLLAGASVGVLAGMLLAPERGRVLRQQIANSASKVGDQVNKTVDMCMTTCKDTMNSWTGKSEQKEEMPRRSNEELNGPANFVVSSDSDSIDKHIL